MPRRPLNNAPPTIPTVMTRQQPAPRVICKTVTIDEMLANPATSEGGSEEIKHVAECINWAFNHIQGREPNSEVVAAVTNFNTDLITYFLNLDHRTHPITGGGKCQYLYQLFELRAGDYSGQNAIYRIGQRCEAKAREEAMAEAIRRAEAREARGKEN